MITQTALKKLKDLDEDRYRLVNRMNTYLNHLDGLVRRGEYKGTERRRSFILQLRTAQGRSRSYQG